jgi:alpha,alpha-trehalase
MTSLQGFPRLSHYAFLSDTHTAALVGPDGAVEWWCTPRFDGPAVCARILDREAGGAVEVTVDGAGPPTRWYRAESLVVESLFASPTGSVRVVDFLALEGPPDRQDDDEELRPARRLVRLVRCSSGSADVSVRLDLRPDYGRRRPDWEDHGSWTSRDPDLTVDGDLPLHEDGGVLTGRTRLTAGQGFAVAVGYARPAAPLDVGAAQRLLDDTEAAWAAWSGRCDYDGYARELVRRSAVALRGLAFDETGALLAAATTSLPEWPGGGRNWDYRYTWPRDASLHVLALARLGHHAEARSYLDFLLRPDVARPGAFPPLVTVDGGTPPPEEELDHLTGYAGSRPVRFGNEAHDQLQWDTYGHVLDAAAVHHRLTGSLEEKHWAVLRGLVDDACDVWRRPDHGLWEVRGQTRRHTYSALMVWVCLDRGLRLAEDLADETADVDRWRRERAQVREAVLTHGYDEEVGAFVQSFGSRMLDASLLRVPLMGFLPGDDPRVLSTLDRVVERLGVGDALLRRYDPDETDDGLDGSEGAFLLCSYDLVSALVLAGRQAEAERRFRLLTDLVGPFGLLTEEMAADGTPLGNYPQAFSHLAQVEAALNIDAARRDAYRQGRTAPPPSGPGRGEALHAWADQQHTP